MPARKSRSETAEKLGVGMIGGAEYGTGVRSLAGAFMISWEVD